jgi:hypothetical protein
MRTNVRDSKGKRKKRIGISAIPAASGIIDSVETVNNLIWLFTVKHTGTHFIMEYFRRMGLQQARMDVVTGSFVSAGEYTHLHIEEPNHMPLMRYDKGPVVVTMRNPIDVHVSWLARYGLAATTTQALVKSFDEMAQVIDKLDPYIFRVDAQNRESEVLSLADYLGIKNFKYEWVDHMDHRGHRGHRHNFPGAYEYEVPLSIRGLAIHFGYQPPTGENNADSDVCVGYSV